MTLKIAIATETCYAPPDSPWEDDGWLKEELEKRGHEISLIDWQDPSVTLYNYDAIYVSTTWNIPQDPNRFLNWLKACESDGKRRLINSSEVIGDNITKSRYLTYLKQELIKSKGSEQCVPPSKFYSLKGDVDDCIQSLGQQTLEGILQELDLQSEWKGKDLVIKPIISADGIETYVYRRTSNPLQAKPEHQLDSKKAQEIFNLLANSPKTKGVILQPYLSAIEKGEYSLVFLDNIFSHAIHKPTGFRADDSKKRQPVNEEQLPTGMVRFAKDILNILEQKYGEGSITRARIDLLDGEHGPLLCELECAEPNTNLGRFEANARNAIVTRYADVIEKQTRTLSV